MNSSGAPGRRIVDLDAALPIEHFSESVLFDLCQRIQKSQTFEQMVCRESELDEVWRLLDFAVRDAQFNLGGAAEIERLEAMRAAIMEVHDLVGVDNDKLAAAARLKRLLSDTRID